MGCSPIKAARELGLERRETVNETLLSINSAICWETRKHPGVLVRAVTPLWDGGGMDSDKLSGDPDNQQGRLEAYLSGFVDGEG